MALSDAARERARRIAAEAPPLSPELIARLRAILGSCPQPQPAAAPRRRKAMPSMPRNYTDLAPCGTEAAARRHQRHHEPVDEACRAAANRAAAERRGADPYSQQSRPQALGPARNGNPEVAYTYRAPRPSWAIENIRRAEAIYGKPPAEPEFEAG
jgi:hypothetical protein